MLPQEVAHETLEIAMSALANIWNSGGVNYLRGCGLVNSPREGLVFWSVDFNRALTSERILRTL